jgi:hypothetical protein
VLHSKPRVAQARHQRNWSLVLNSLSNELAAHMSAQVQVKVHDTGIDSLKILRTSTQAGECCKQGRLLSPCWPCLGHDLQVQRQRDDTARGDTMQ